MITFKQQITVPEELVQGFAIELGWLKEVHLEDGTLIPNPITAEEYVQEKAKEVMQNFFLPFGRKLVEQQLAEARTQLEQAIIVPVKEALITEVVRDND